MVSVVTLASLVLPRARRRIIATFAAYFDESGTHAGSAVTTIACYVAPETLWSRFERRWSGFLGSYYIPYFRMSECENKRGVFKGFSERSKIRCIRDAHSIIREFTTFGVAVSVDVKAYQRIIPG